MNFIVKKFYELTVDELWEIYKSRMEVFVVEQECAYQDIDEMDKEAIHVMAMEGDKMQAYVRVLPPKTMFEEVSIGRVISLKRRCGIGSAAILEGIRVAKHEFDAQKIKIKAQTYAVPVYEKTGFQVTSDEFLEDGIPHVEMIWTRE